MLSKCSWLLPLILCGAAFAQSTSGYLFVAPGGWTQRGATRSVYEAGGGAERSLDRGIGAGMELEGAVPAVGRASNAIGIFSINGFYHFLKERPLDPFATMGYSLVFRDFTANGFNYGGGLRYWFRDNRGLLVEMRDHSWGQPGAPRAHVWGVRIGLTFR